MKLLLYCTKNKPYLNDCKLTNNNKRYFTSNKGMWSIDLSTQKTYSALNGKIVAECDYEIEEIKRINTVGDWFYYEKQDGILEKSCIVDVNKFFEYLRGNNGYAIHIKNLRIFDKPKEFSECCFLTLEKGFLRPLKKAPQNMCYALTTEIYKDILISIRPEWLCKILNGEKTIEIRKKVLKGMVKDDK